MDRWPPGPSHQRRRIADMVSQAGPAAVPARRRSGGSSRDREPLGRDPRSRLPGRRRDPPRALRVPHRSERHRHRDLPARRRAVGDARILPGRRAARASGGRARSGVHQGRETPCPAIRSVRDSTLPGLRRGHQRGRQDRPGGGGDVGAGAGAPRQDRRFRVLLELRRAYGQQRGLLAGPGSLHPTSAEARTSITKRSTSSSRSPGIACATT